MVLRKGVTLVPTIIPTSIPTSLPTLTSLPTPEPTVIPTYNSLSIEVSDLKKDQGFIIMGADQSHYTGDSVSKAGDFNGDGFGDIIISACGAAKSYIIFGKQSNSAIDLTNLNPKRGFTISGISGCLNSHHKYVSYLGDINKDGYDDVIIGTYGTASKYFAGRSYVLLGKAHGSHNINVNKFKDVKGFKIFGEAAGDQSGYSVSGAGDVNGDGYNDILIGAWQASPEGRAHAGAAYVIYGKESGFSNIHLARLKLQQGFKIIGAAPNDHCSALISGAGDINGDGYDDIIIGAHSGTGTETAYVLFGKSEDFIDIDLSNLNLKQGFIITGIRAGAPTSNTHLVEVILCCNLNISMI